MNLKETYNKTADYWYNDHKTDDWVGRRARDTLVFF